MLFQDASAAFLFFLTLRPPLLLFLAAFLPQLAGQQVPVPAGNVPHGPKLLLQMLVLPVAQEIRASSLFSTVLTRLRLFAHQLQRQADI